MIGGDGGPDCRYVNRSMSVGRPCSLMDESEEDIDNLCGFGTDVVPSFK